MRDSIVHDSEGNSPQIRVRVRVRVRMRVRVSVRVMVRMPLVDSRRRGPSDRKSRVCRHINLFLETILGSKIASLLGLYFEAI